MMNRKYIQFIILILVLALSACTPRPDSELYEGGSLRVAVVGEPPEVLEEHIVFDQVSFTDVKNEEFDEYDAVIITQENLIEASESKYADIYLNSIVPFFFISANSHVPFTVKETEFDRTWNWAPGTNYAVGLLVSKEDEALKTWGYGLHNEELNNEHVKDVYSRIFKTIDEDLN